MLTPVFAVKPIDYRGFRKSRGITPPQFPLRHVPVCDKSPFATRVGYFYRSNVFDFLDDNKQLYLTFGRLV